MLAAGLARACERAGIPIVGVSIGSASDRSTWVVHFKSHATSGQRADVQAILQTYDVATDTGMQNEEAEITLAQKALGSLARVTWEHLPASGRPTWMAFLDRWKAIYRSL